MKISLLFKATTFFTILFLFTACEKDFTEQMEVNTENQEILDYLATQNYVLDSVTFKDDMVFYETDMAWRKDHLLKRSRGEFEFMEIESPEPLNAALAGERQRALDEDFMQDALTRQNASNIRYFISNSVGIIVHALWIVGINNAANEWNALPNCRITFTRVFNENQADIIFTTDNLNNIPTGLQDLPIGTIAATFLPQNGATPGFIVINDFWQWHWKMKTVIMHEMGHAIGFHHTGTDEGSPVFGTPFNQSGSVMNPSSSSASSTLRFGDIRMARLFYPNSLPRPVSASTIRASAGTARIRYQNPNMINSPYYWVRLTKYTAAGQILAERFVRSTSNATGIHTVNWGGHGTGQFRFAVRGYNFKRDVWSSRTARMLVNL